MRLLIVTGLPATGKSTLAAQLAARYRVPLLAKDIIKESLLAETGPVDAARSRHLSDLAFNMLFAQLRQHADAGIDTVVEGNFRAGQHEPVLGALPVARLAQMLCRVDEEERQRRITLRARDPARHPAHGDARAARDASNDCFLELPGVRLLLATAAATPEHAALLQRLDHWWYTAAAADATRLTPSAAAPR